MSISIDKFEEVKKNSGEYASWAIWKEYNDTMASKEGIEDLSIFDDESKIVNRLNDKFVLVALNGAEHDTEKRVWGSFHSSDKKRENDFKLRYALQGTKLWGSYITDFMLITKTDSNEAIKEYNSLSQNDKENNISRLQKEINIINKDAIIIAIGKDARKLIDESGKFKNNKIYDIPHYSARNYNDKEEYKNAVYEIIKNII